MHPKRQPVFLQAHKILQIDSTHKLLPPINYPKRLLGESKSTGISSQQLSFNQLTLEQHEHLFHWVHKALSSDGHSFSGQGHFRDVTLSYTPKCITKLSQKQTLFSSKYYFKEQKGSTVLNLHKTKDCQSKDSGIKQLTKFSNIKT